MLSQYKEVSIKQNPNEKELREGKRWPNIPWLTYSFYNFNGDGQLFYPGKNQNELWPTIRLINTRDGIEDYEIATEIKKINLSNSTKKRYEQKIKWLIRFKKLLISKRLDKTKPIELIKLKKEALIILSSNNKFKL